MEIVIEIILIGSAAILIVLGVARIFGTGATAAPNLPGRRSGVRRAKSPVRLTRTPGEATPVRATVGRGWTIRGVASPSGSEGDVLGGPGPRGFREPAGSSENPAAEPTSAGPPLADWLEALSHDSPFEGRPDAAAGGPAAPPLTALPSLFALLRDPSRDVRVRVVTALGDLAGEAHQALPRLRGALKETALHDDDPLVRAQAVRAVLRAGPEPGSEVPALIDCLRNPLDVVRFHAAVALGELGTEACPAVAALTSAALWDEDPAVRVEAAVALWKVERRTFPLVVPALIKGLGDDNELVCWIAADCLGQIGPEAREAAPALRQALGRPFKVALIRKGVALALARIDPQAVSESGVG